MEVKIHRSLKDRSEEEQKLSRVDIDKRVTENLKDEGIMRSKDGKRKLEGRDRKKVEKGSLELSILVEQNLRDTCRM